MRFGLYVPNFGAFGEARVLASLAVEAEEAGWHGLFTWDHVDRAFATDVADPWIALTAVACRTTRLRFGALVTPLARRRPWKLARETVTLDRLSGGRLVFGAGLGSAGGAEVEWANLGEETDLARRAEKLDEGLAILEGLWSGEPFAFEGRHYRIARTVFAPRPLQRPRIPVWIAGSWPPRGTAAPFRRAAAWDGVFPLLEPGADVALELARIRDLVRSQRASAAQFDLVHLARPGTDRDLLTACANAGVTWWLERLTPDEFDERWEGEWPLDAMRAHVRRGPPVEGAR
jgi:alkanesulfonate monooxygenase SsuD/methylene tetrahydromethanopterin reductase-like flavin-dependent oxidoreductase (luciferase family)